MGGKGSGSPVNLSKDELLGEIVRVSNLDNTSDNPTSSDMNKYGKVSAPLYQSRFGSWPNAKKLAGFNGNSKGFGSTEERTCAECGDTKIVNSSNYRMNNGDWVCSDECRYSYYRVSLSCDECDTDFDRRKSSLRPSRDGVFCSKECFNNNQRSGENNHRRELQSWAHQVKESYNYKCVKCGNSYEVMCAHHNPPKSELSKYEQLNPENGVCLCYPCHADEHEGPQRRVLLGWWEWYNSGK